MMIALVMVIGLIFSKLGEDAQEMMIAGIIIVGATEALVELPILLSLLSR